jgi:hypothetical protein
MYPASIKHSDVLTRMAVARGSRSRHPWRLLAVTIIPSVVDHRLASSDVPLPNIHNSDELPAYLRMPAFVSPTIVAHNNILHPRVFSCVDDHDIDNPLRITCR